jgi:hypothetical protein
MYLNGLRIHRQRMLNFLDIIESHEKELGNFIKRNAAHKFEDRNFMQADKVKDATKEPEYKKANTEGLIDINDTESTILIRWILKKPEPQTKNFFCSVLYRLQEEARKWVHDTMYHKEGDTICFLQSTRFNNTIINGFSNRISMDFQIGFLFFPHSLLNHIMLEKSHCQS